MDPSIYTNLFKLIDASAFGMASSLVPYSINLLGVLLLILLTWNGIKAALGGGIQDFMSSLFLTLITASLMFPVLLNWSSGSLSLPLAVLAMVEDLAKTLGGDTSAVTAGMKSINTAMKELMTVPFTYKTASPAGGWGIGMIVEFMFDAVTTVPNLLLAVVGLLGLGIMAALMIGVQVIGDIMLAVAMVLGPFLLAWSVLPLTSFLRDGLLRFTFNGILLKLVGIVLAKIVGNAAIVLTTHKLVTGGQPNLIAIITLVGLIAMMLYVMFQANTLAQGLVSGGALDAPGGSLKRAVTSKMMKR